MFDTRSTYAPAKARAGIVGITTAMPDLDVASVTALAVSTLLGLGAFLWAVLVITPVP